MASINDWNKFINLTHELALVEYDLRSGVSQDTILFERF